jgi:nucleotide-binding universal stress UspA family protein
MIVVGARGAGGALRSLLGSVSRELTGCPAHVVAVVPPDERTDDAGPRPILVGVDGSDGSARALRWAADAAARAGVDVVAVHAFTSPIPDPVRAEVTSLVRERRERLEEEWCAPLRAVDVPYRAVLEEGDARDVIRRVADEVRPICGVVGSRGLGAFSARLLGSVTHHLARELAWPVVIVPSARDRAIWPPLPAAAEHR